MSNETKPWPPWPPETITPEQMREDAMNGAITEIRGGMLLRPVNDVDEAWNQACERAVRICRRYRDGTG